MKTELLPTRHAKTGHPNRFTPMIMALEPRIMFDGAAIADVMGDIGDHHVSDHLDPQPVIPNAVEHQATDVRENQASPTPNHSPVRWWW